MAEERRSRSLLVSAEFADLIGDTVVKFSSTESRLESDERLIGLNEPGWA